MSAIIILALLATVAAATAITISWRRTFLTHPLQASLRAFLGIFVILLGNLAVPSFEIVSTVNLDLPFGDLRGQVVKITSGENINWIIAFISTSFLACVCLVRVPPTRA